MPQRRNEITSQIRSEPMSYVAVYNASNQVTYEAWGEPGISTSDALWVACAHTYDASGNLTRTKWADGGRFTQTATDISSLTYS